jgi:hypothetical protein
LEAVKGAVALTGGSVSVGELSVSGVGEFVSVPVGVRAFPKQLLH